MLKLFVIKKKKQKAKKKEKKFLNIFGNIHLEI